MEIIFFVVIIYLVVMLFTYVIMPTWRQIAEILENPPESNDLNLSHKDDRIENFEE